MKELAETTETDAPTLYRVLRGLASLGVFAEDDAGSFGLTPLAECLRSDAPGSQRANAIMRCGPSFWSSWGDLLTTVKTGETAFPRVHGMDRWDYLVRHPEESTIFDAAMTSLTARFSAAIAGGYDFSRFGVLADVGGGAGRLLATILAANPSMRGILFDQPQVVAARRRSWRRQAWLTDATSWREISSSRSQRGGRLLAQEHHRRLGR